jgi:protease PrsW
MREVMAPEVKLGVVTPDELDALAGSRSTLKNYIRSQPNRLRAERVLEAETDLSRQIARDDGCQTEAVRGARAAVARARGS